MQVTKAMALRQAMRDAKDAADAAFNSAWEALDHAVQPYAYSADNQVPFELTEWGGTMSAAEQALIEAESKAGLLKSSIRDARVRVRDASIDMEHQV